MQPVAVAAEFFGVAINPADRAPHLLDHREQAAFGVVDIGEVEHDEMRAGMHERLGQAGELGRSAVPPSAAVNEDRDRRVRLWRAINIEPFDRRRAVGEAQRLAEPRQRRGAVGEPPLADLVAVRRVDDLVVGVVELLLVHIEPDDRAFDFASLRRSRSSCSSFPQRLHCAFGAVRINQFGGAFDDGFRRRISLRQHFGNLVAGHRLDLQLRLRRVGDELGIRQRLLKRLAQRRDPVGRRVRRRGERPARFLADQDQLHDLLVLRVFDQVERARHVGQVAQFR